MRRLLISCLLLSACAAPIPPDSSPSGPSSPTLDDPQDPPTHALPHGLPPPASDSDRAPGLVRPPWNGERKAALTTPVRNYPVTWKGEIQVSRLTLAGGQLYTVDRRLYSVPLQGGVWTPVDDGTGPAKTHLVSDGQRVYAGTRNGSIVGYDAESKQTWQAGSVPAAITGLQLSSAGLLVATEKDGLYQIQGGVTKQLAPAASLGAVRDVAIAGSETYALGDRIWRVANATCTAIPGTEWATALTSDRRYGYAGTADGWLLRLPREGAAQPLAKVCESPIESLGTDGSWLYSSSDNTTYMLDLKHFQASLCHPGFPSVVTSLTVQDGQTVLVGTRKGLYSMPR